MEDQRQAPELAKQIQRWEKETLASHLKRHPEEKPVRKTSSEIEISTVHFPLCFDEGSYLSKLGFPGEHPFTRGVYPNMYRGKLWTFRQYAGYGTCEQTNERFKYLLSRGQTGLSVAFDLPTQMGYDSDHPICVGEVGRAGVAIDTIEDMERLFEGIPLDRVSTSMTINSTACVILAMFIGVAESRGIPRQKLSGTVQN
ncbi:MAG TPA: methylmalonyl-CoA mutase, partial [Firmicutes bacterium]|nr:methylmalonyl-CoA mutase [Bacillota bacterium]